MLTRGRLAVEHVGAAVIAAFGSIWPVAVDYLVTPSLALADLRVVLKIRITPHLAGVNHGHYLHAVIVALVAQHFPNDPQIFHCEKTIIILLFGNGDQNWLA